MTCSSVAEQFQRHSTIPRLMCARRRRHVRSHGVGAEEDAIEDVRDGTTSRCVDFSAVESVKRARWRYINIARHCWKDWV